MGKMCHQCADLLEMLLLQSQILKLKEDIPALQGHLYPALAPWLASLKK